MSDQPTALRRAPSQRRAKERVEKILEVATRLIAEKGGDALKMGEVAERAGVSIGSLYQYFNDKAAIVGALAERINAAGLLCIEAELADVRRPAELRAAFVRLIDVYYGLFLADPVTRDVWAAAQADKSLQAMELQNSRANGAALAAAMARARPDADRKALETSAFLVMQLGEATMRIAIAVPRKEGDAVVEAYKRMALAEIAPDPG